MLTRETDVQGRGLQSAKGRALNPKLQTLSPMCCPQGRASGLGSREILEKSKSP